MGEFEQTGGQAVSGAFGIGYIEYVIIIIAFFGVLLCIAWLTRWLAGKAGKMRGRYLSIIDSLSLGPNRGLYLILLVDRLFLVGTAERSVNLVAEIDEPGLVDEVLKKGEGSPFQHNRGFFQYLQRVITPGEGREDGGGDPGPAVREIRAKISDLRKNSDKREEDE
ncbi:MAG: flagellar biosynthetic protein FliO [Firmicutes bacterium]|jgi:flagellar protein FliO/FliZ|nr:flagellar biosynthetic protein FliO [Bacillota bacterium]